MRRRILFITGEYPPMRGGIGDYTEHLVEALAALGWDARVLVSQRAGSNPDPRVLARVARWGWRLADDVRRAVSETQAEIVHLQYQTGAFQMHPAVNILPLRLSGPGNGNANGRRVPFVTTFHDLLPPYLFPKAGPLRRTVTRVLASASDAVVVTNAEDLATLQRYRRIAPHLHHIPIGSNLPRRGTQDRASVRARLGIDDAAFAVGFFGFLTRDKGLDRLGEALRRFSSIEVRLVIVGGALAETDQANAEYYSRLQADLARAPFPVTRTGHLPPDQAAATLGALDLIALPFRGGASLRRGTLIAALGSGVPVLTTDPGAEDALKPFRGGESLWLVPADDTDALAGAIEMFARNRELGHQFAARALDLTDEFAWEAIARRHDHLYRDLLDN